MTVLRTQKMQMHEHLARCPACQGLAHLKATCPGCNQTGLVLDGVDRNWTTEVPLPGQEEKK